MDFQESKAKEKDDEDEDKSKPTREPGGKPKKLTNQFNFSERASQTYNNPSRVGDQISLIFSSNQKISFRIEKHSLNKHHVLLVRIMSLNGLSSMHITKISNNKYTDHRIGNNSQTEIFV